MVFRRSGRLGGHGVKCSPTSFLSAADNLSMTASGLSQLRRATSHMRTQKTSALFKRKFLRSCPFEDPTCRKRRTAGYRGWHRWLPTPAPSPKLTVSQVGGYFIFWKSEVVSLGVGGGVAVGSPVWRVEACGFGCSVAWKRRHLRRDRLHYCAEPLAPTPFPTRRTKNDKHNERQKGTRPQTVSPATPEPTHGGAQVGPVRWYLPGAGGPSKG